MVKIAPFRALRYDANKVRLRTVSSPPHDCITPEEAETFRKNPHNICHVILPPGTEEEDPKARFERASAILQKWLAEGVLTRDEEPAYYLYEVEWKHGGQPKRMLGMFARLGLDPTYKEVRRHELTLSKKKRERFDLQMASQTNTESIWLLYRDERGWVEEILFSNSYDELLSFTDEQAIHHRLYRVHRPEAVEEITAQFEDRFLVIADGHHRYQTALDVYAQTGRPEDSSLLVCLVRDDSPGITIEPTHRLIQKPIALSALLKVAKAAFHVSEPEVVTTADATRLREIIQDAEDTFLLLTKHEDGVHAYTLRLHEDRIEAEAKEVERLRVGRLHNHFLHPAGITEAGEDWGYLRTDVETIEAVASGQVAHAVMLGPERVQAVLDVAAEGDVMPQKSTFFLPKLRSGLVLGPNDEAPPKGWTPSGDGGPKQFNVPDL